MPVKTRQIGPCFAAEVEGVDLTRPLSPDEVAAVHAGMDEHAVLVFRDQPLDDVQQLAFTARSTWSWTVRACIWKPAT